MVATPANYGLANSLGFACTSVDPGPGIGIGTSQVNSALCTDLTTQADVNGNTYPTFVFADQIYPTPAAHAIFGDYVFQKVIARW